MQEKSYQIQENPKKTMMTLKAVKKAKNLISMNLLN